MKYSDNFERDWNWYNKHTNNFNFDARTPDEYIDKKGEPLIKEDFNHGKRAKECFWHWDTKGKIPNTCEPILLLKILKCKGSINFNIRMWAEDRAKGLLPWVEFEKIIKEYELLDWMVEAVEKQKYKYYK